MTEEPRRSGRATKGLHNKNASSSPAPGPKPTKGAKSKPPKKSLEPSQTEEDYDEDDEEIRCICGNNNPKDRRAFIGCDDCSVWQHNVCMGMPEDDDEVPDSYLCEQCGPDDHRETLEALAKGEKIWEARNKIYANEKKMSKNRKGKSGRPGWLKKETTNPEAQENIKEDTPSQETGTKRKRGEEVKPEPVEPIVKDEEDEKPTRPSRQDKRRKPSVPPDPETEIVGLDKLPSDRQKIASALSKVISDDVSARSKAGTFRIPDGHTPKSLGEYYATRIEYAMTMNHESPSTEGYKARFRALNANLKRNKVLLERLFDGSMTADELSTMDIADMASEELQKERAEMKEQLDRQATAVQADGPRYRRTHKGDELIEDIDHGTGDAGNRPAAPVRERTSVVDTEMADAGSPTAVQADGAGSPTTTSTAGQALRVDTNKRESTTTSAHERRQSSQQFDMNNIWAKTAQSPTQPSAAPRPMQMPPRRRSSMQNSQQQGTGIQDDADIDRMLQDDEEETYSPADYTAADAIVWRGQLVQGADNVSPTVNARYVAGRDISSTVAWKDLLPSKLAVDGRLGVDKAEEYLCSLQWSRSSDVSVLILTPYDDKAAFDTVFNYFKGRERYAVVKNDKPPMVKDLYIIPLDVGEALPEHVNLLEFNRLGQGVEEKSLLATFVISRSPDTPSISQAAIANTSSQSQSEAPGSMNGHHLPTHMRAGPAGSPINASGATFSPTNTAYGGSSSIPPNPYSSTPPQPAPPHQAQPQPHPNPLVSEILGPLQYAPTALQVVGADPNIERVKLVHLRQILDEDPNSRTDIEALATKLFAEG